jgi:LytS/YehU family sensor histidine kinase
MVVASVAVAIVHVSILGCIETSLLPPQEASWLVITLFAAMRWSMVFFIWFAIYCGYGVLEQRREGELRAVQAEKALKDAELSGLRAQLNPHFLFNALNSIRALVSYEPALAEDAITRIARILRHSLATDREQTVTLGRELDIVDDYLALEGLRLADRLVVERTISDEARAARIPILLVQLLIENALKHGIAQLPRGGVIRIKATIAESVLELEVENPRPKRSDVADSTGLGLSNAEGRLRLLFGGDATLKLDLSSPSTAIACARIPTGYDPNA